MLNPSPENERIWDMLFYDFEVFKEDFRKTAMDYLMFQQGIDAKEFGDKLLTAAMYSSEICRSDDSVSISIKAGDDDGAD